MSRRIPPSEENKAPSEKEPEFSAGSGAKPEDWDELGRMLRRHWIELRSDGGRYVDANFDLIRLKLSRLAVYVILSALLGLIGTAACVVAVTYGTRGLAELLEHLYGGRRWASDLSVCIVVIGTIFLVGRIAVKTAMTALHKDVKARYETRQAERAELERNLQSQADDDAT